MKYLIDEWLVFFEQDSTQNNWWLRKTSVMKGNGSKVVRIIGKGHVYHVLQYDNVENIHYLLHLTYFTKQSDFYYVEERVIPYKVRTVEDEIVSHEAVNMQQEQFRKTRPSLKKQRITKGFTYDRHAAVQYAEHWWNSYNPRFERFTVDCTNFVSQCLLAGGAPMQGASNREQGWWYEGGSWSFSWSVAHSLRWHLSGSTSGLNGKEVQEASELRLGDVICYDFEGDGRWDHNTIVVAKDIHDEPLVNAHTDNSRHRYWSYEDSTAWTPNIKYKFFQIGE